MRMQKKNKNEFLFFLACFAPQDSFLKSLPQIPSILYHHLLIQYSLSFQQFQAAMRCFLLPNGFALG